MGADSLQTAVLAAAWTGLELDGAQTELLCRLHAWLASEAMVAGGIGPHEGERIWSRHIADSLVLGSHIRNSVLALDIGSGVGLPGIPLAIANPQTHFELVDRSQRRCDLMRRALAVLGLANCTVVCADVADLGGKFRAIISRAAIPPPLMMIHVKHLLEPGGIAVLSLSRTDTTPIPVPTTPGLVARVVVVPPDILDTGAHLLRIEAT